MSPKKIFRIIVITLVAFGCKEEKLVLPTVDTLDAVDITFSSAKLKGVITNDGHVQISDHGFVWSYGSNPDIEDQVISLGGTNGTRSYSQTIDDFPIDINFCYRAYIELNSVLYYGEALCSKTLTRGIWTQKADFPGEPRTYATGFSLQGKGYVGTGWSGRNMNDFWEFDPLNNTWSRKASFPGRARADAVSFVTENLGFIAFGRARTNGTSFSPTVDLWQYDPGVDHWEMKHQFPGNYLIRFAPVHLTIGNWAYYGGGDRTSAFARINLSTFEREGLAPLPSDFGILSYAVSVSANGIGYVCTGSTFNSRENDFYSYDPESNSWTRLPPFLYGPSGERSNAVGFMVKNKFYIGMGRAFNGIKQDFYEFNAITRSWIETTRPMLNGKADAVGFSINEKGYIITGSENNESFTNDTWEFSPENN